MKTLKWLCMLAMLPMLWACSSTEEEPEITVPTGNEDYFLKNMDFDSGAGTKTFTFSTNGDWAISLSPTRSGTNWATVSPMSGKKGVNTITVTVAANTEYDDRSVALTLTTGTLSKNVTIHQKQLDALTLTRNKFELEPQGGTFDVEVKANVDYTIDIDANAQGWITKGSSSRGLSTTTTTFKVAATEEYDKREGVLIVRSGMKSEEIHVYQSGQAILLLSPTEVPVQADGDVVKVEVKSNFDYEVLMPQVDWLRECSGARGLSSHTIYYEIDRNEAYEPRSAEIVFKDKHSSLTNTLTINQMQTDALVVANTAYTVSNTGGEIVLKVGHNVDFDVAIAEDWITRKASRAFVEEELAFVVAPNEGYDNRENTITITSKDKSLTQVVKVYQAQTNALVVSPTAECVSDAGGSVTIVANANIDVQYAVQEGVDWLHLVEARGLSPHTFVFAADPNETYEPRSAEVRFFNTQYGLSQVVTITQVQKDAIVLGMDSYQMDCLGGTFSVELGHNVEYTVKIADDWVAQTTPSRAFTTDKLYFTVQENTETENRETTITFQSKDEKITQVLHVYQYEAGRLIVSELEKTVPAEASQFDLAIETNVNFKVEVQQGADWLHKVEARSLATHTIRFAVDANDDVETREASIIVTNLDTNEQQMVKVTQMQKDAIVVANARYDVSNDGGQVIIKVGHNVDFDISIADPWVRQVSSRAYVEDNLVFDVDKNDGYDSRQTTITFASKDKQLKQEVAICQSPVDAIIISEKEIALGSGSSTFEVVINSNVDYAITVQNGVTWLREANNGRALTEHRHKYVATANDTYDSRSAEIIVTNKATGDMQVVTVTQAQKDAIVLGMDHYTIDSKGGSVTLDLQHNVPYTVSIQDPTWVHQVTSRGLVANQLTFTVDENTGYDNRSNVITIQSEDGKITQTFTINQTQMDALILVSEHARQVEAAGDTIHIQVNTNVDFEVQMPAGCTWLHQLNSGSRGLAGHTIVIQVDANDTEASREAVVTIVNRNNPSQRETVTITQAKPEIIVQWISKADLNGWDKGVIIDNDYYVCEHLDTEINETTGVIGSFVTSEEITVQYADGRIQRLTNGTETFYPVYVEDEGTDVEKMILVKDDGTVIEVLPDSKSRAINQPSLPRTYSNDNPWWNQLQSINTMYYSQEYLWALQKKSLEWEQKRKSGRSILSDENTYSETKSKGEVVNVQDVVQSSNHQSKCPDEHHPHFIDLGLPSGTKWACCNVGSSKPESLGGYYAWGETNEKSTYDRSTYSHMWYSTAIGSNKVEYYDIGWNIAGTYHDVAHHHNRGSMPTMNQVKELMSNCTPIWTQQNGVKGILVIGKNGNQIFLPATGSRSDKDLHFVGTHGYYWTSMVCESSSTTEVSGSAQTLHFNSKKWEASSGPREHGNTVRPVSTASNPPTPPEPSVCPDEHHPHAIDLGLPSGTKWACCNVGASKPEEYGGYYAWGETSEKSYYDESTYLYYQNNNYVNIGSDIAGTQYDVAHVRMGGSWRMPTEDQIKELLNNCTWTWTQRNGVNGILVTGPNGGQIFLPAAGYRWIDSLYYEGSFSNDWSSTLYPDDDYCAYGLYFFSDYWFWNYYVRAYGLSVRAVCP